MIPWTVTLAALLGATACDVWNRRRIPVVLAALPLAAWVWETAWSPAALGFGVSCALIVVGVSGWARIGVGDQIMLASVAPSLGLWSLLLLVVTLTGSIIQLRARREATDPLMPHVTLGFLVASAARWSS